MVRKREDVGFKTLAYIVISLFTLVCIIPFISILAKSFSTPNRQVGLWPNGWDFYSYGIVLRDNSFYRAFGISIAVTTLGTVLSVAILSLAAYPLSKKGFPMRRAFMLYFVIIMLFTGGIVPCFLWYKMIGLTDTFAILILPNLVSVYNLILIKSYFENLPESVEEAARIDGAGNVKVLFKIVLPMCAPILVTIGLFTVVAFWNNYQTALYYLPTRSDLFPIAMHIQNFVAESAVNVLFGDQKRADHKENIEAAMIVLSILPIVAAYPFTLKYFTSGITLGAVKA